MMIMITILVGILLIIWLQYPQIKKEEDVPLYRYMFDIIKVPIIFTCIVIIIYLNKDIIKKSKPLNTKVFKVYMGLPHF